MLLIKRLSDKMFLTIFIMSPVLSEVYTSAIIPYMDETLSFDDAIKKAEAPVVCIYLIM